MVIYFKYSVQNLNFDDLNNKKIRILTTKSLKNQFKSISILKQFKLTRKISIFVHFYCCLIDFYNSDMFMLLVSGKFSSI